MVIIASAGLTRGDSAHGADSGRQTSGGGRVLLPLDTDWRFQRAQAEEAVSEGFDDSKWQKITLPHTFNGADGEDGGDYYRGPGWYRRRLILTESLAGRRAFLQFDGAALTTDVYVNGTLAGRHEGGYAAFRIDVTRELRRGENRIAVRVDNTKVPHIAPLGGDFTVFGGLYRRVFLLLTPEVHVDTLDYGGPGIYVSTSEVRAGISARFSITAQVRNDRVRTATVLIASSVLDADGKVVAETQRRMIVPAASTAKAMMAGTISEPRLWDGTRDPYLYRVVTEVRDVRARRQADAVTVPLGVRTVAIDPQRGFLLNGKPLGVHGVNLFHSGRPGRGLAVTDAEIRQDLAVLKELNVTGVRFVHFQHPQLAYEEADRLGFIVWTEIPLNGAVDSGPAFEENITQQMRELIRQNYNHPSVAVWGIGNEVYASTADVSRILDSVQRVAKLEDGSRPTAYAHCCQSDDNEKALHSDVGAFNRYFGWYPEQKGQIGAWAESFHQRFPERAFAVSEYGAGASIRHQEDPPRPPVPASGWHPEQYQALFHETSWRQLQPLHYIWGTFVWVAFDLASDGRSEGDRPGINDKGLVTYDRAVKKDAFFWYQANWSSEPMLHLTSARLELRSVEEVEVKVYTNVDRVTLEVDGVGRGVVDVSDHIARWPRVKLHAGENRIQVRATADGREFTDSAVWTYQKSLVETAR